MLKKIFTIIIFSSVIFLIPISSTKALQLNDLPSLEKLYLAIQNSNSSVRGACRNGIAIVYRDSYTSQDKKYYAYCTTSSFMGASMTTSYTSDFTLDRSSNYYNIDKLYSFNQNSNVMYRPQYILEYVTQDDDWEFFCSGSIQPYCVPQIGVPNTNYVSLTSSDVIVAYITLFPYTNPYGDSQSRAFYYNFESSNTTIFNYDYNIYNYYSLLNNWQESSYTYLEQPDLVLGSHTDFESDDLTSVPSYTYGNYSNYNNYVYTIDEVDTDYALLGTSFNYNYYSDSNYKLGFVVTYRKSTDTPILVYAQTNEGTYACNSTSVMAKNDITYQWYVECPSVDVSSDSDLGYLTIRIEGAYDTSSVVGPRPVWDTNDIFYTDAGVVGISPIVKSVTSVDPTPIGPPEPTPDIDIIDSIDNINNTITDETLPDTSVLSNSAGWLPPGPVDSIINMPLSLFSSLSNMFSNSATCQPIFLPLPFLNNQFIQLPCFNTIIQASGFQTIWETFGSIAAAYVLYKYFINLYAWVDKTLTFRENNWQDWGGI